MARMERRRSKCELAGEYVGRHDGEHDDHPRHHEGKHRCAKARSGDRPLPADGALSDGDVVHDRRCAGVGAFGDPTNAGGRGRLACGRLVGRSGGGLWLGRRFGGGIASRGFLWRRGHLEVRGLARLGDALDALFLAGGP